ncbi:MAG TPA: DUF3943 domain-containing protein [Prolixibacteraceae bacterium]|nr:DUF3943 domain-containing protein [Prolixibacteraceae bacterium]HPS13753.1 DUF3943 domain-containing protein [Prolixibacteraceae bacterium]
MIFRRNILLLFFLLISFSLKAQINVNTDTIFHIRQNNLFLQIPEKSLNAAGLVLGTNMGVWAFDRFISKDTFAYINSHTIKRNFKTGFAWDNDGFKTNLFLHPYHGGIYFNAARSNGMSFWQSVPFVAAGSLGWEFFMETEPPAINDFFATTIGGTCLGEMNFRISDLIIDDRTRGLERFGREALLTIVSPMRGITRMINGQSGAHRTVRGNSLPLPQSTFYLTTGHRFLSAKTPIDKDVSNMISYNLGLYYGNPFDEDNSKPYDFFILKEGGNINTAQPVISYINALGMLYSTGIHLKNPNRQLMIGFFQHYNFYFSKAEINHEELIPYKISEAASFGPGLMYKSKVKSDVDFSGSFHLSGILLGGSYTDHYKYANRDYNMGSGFSSKLNFELLIRNKVRFYLKSEHYRIYSWKGYDPSMADNVTHNVQGDKGHATLSVVNLTFSYILKGHYLISTESGLFFRRSVYAYFPTVQNRAFENKICVGYVF